MGCNRNEDINFRFTGYVQKNYVWIIWA
jgi:hypothetical protein